MPVKPTFPAITLRQTYFSRNIFTSKYFPENSLQFWKKILKKFLPRKKLANPYSYGKKNLKIGFPRLKNHINTGETHLPILGSTPHQMEHQLKSTKFRAGQLESDKQKEPQTRHPASRPGSFESPHSSGVPFPLELFAQIPASPRKN